MAEATEAAVRRRFQMWKLVIATALIGDALITLFALPIARLGFWAAAIALVAMLALLVSTPSNAIVLPRSRSERLIVAGAVALLTAAVTRSPLPMGSLYDAASVVIVSVVALLLCRASRTSAWWSALIAWNPLAIAFVRWSREI